MGARQTRTRTVVVTRSRVRSSSNAKGGSKPKRTSKRCPACGRYI